ncbi:MAG: VWA domain-containing protein [Actinobacteria bacterium]|nr:VWA domain-containing protein [Actinomycetota bacterium]MBW3641926.1 VWA domain-containing protein [Actinomycetota bacterium]
MTFLAPERLVLSIAVAALAAAYVVVQVRGRRRYALRFTNLALLGSVAPASPGWRRHLPAALLLVALLGLVAALAHPARAELVPRERATIVMAIDVSISMDATDVRPSRLASAKQAATSFAELLPERINLGLVAFAGSARVLVSPTTDRSMVTAAIERLELSESTAIGDGVLASLDAIESVPDAVDGEPVPAHILLLSDGETQVGTPNQLAAETARDAGVPVTTIAFGTPEGVISYQGQTVPVAVNQADLRALADETGGSSFEAATTEELESVYRDIGSSIGFVTEQREIGGWFTGAAFVLAMLAGAASLLWFSRLP